jgi:hypothetical protein
MGAPESLRGGGGLGDVGLDGINIGDVGLSLGGKNETLSICADTISSLFIDINEFVLYPPVYMFPFDIFRCSLGGGIGEVARSHDGTGDEGLPRDDGIGEVGLSRDEGLGDEGLSPCIESFGGGDVIATFDPLLGGTGTELFLVDEELVNALDDGEIPLSLPDGEVEAFIYEGSLYERLTFTDEEFTESIEIIDSFSDFCDPSEPFLLGIIFELFDISRDSVDCPHLCG